MKDRALLIGAHFTYPPAPLSFAPAPNVLPGSGLHELFRSAPMYDECRFPKGADPVGKVRLVEHMIETVITSSAIQS